MAFEDYATLQTSIADWLNRGDLAGTIPVFIALAEAEFNRSLRVRDMLKRATAEVDGRFLELPDLCQELRNVRLEDELYGLKLRTPEQLDDLRSQYPTPGKPKFYSVAGFGLEFLPIPPADLDSPYIVELTYYERINPLTNSNVNNWLLVKHPDLYLYGSLMQSAPYLKDDARAGLWATAQDRVMSSIRGESDRAEYSGSTPVATLRRL